MVKRKLGALEKVEADLYVLLLFTFITAACPPEISSVANEYISSVTGPIYNIKSAEIRSELSHEKQQD